MIPSMLSVCLYTYIKSFCHPLALALNASSKIFEEMGFLFSRPVNTRNVIMLREVERLDREMERAMGRGTENDTILMEVEGLDRAMERAMGRGGERGGRRKRV
jgi:hypothetical protein